jgi:threonine/homoserine/homoserine lactone efflux protein
MRVFGVILMIIGFLVLSIAGLCTIIFGGMILSEGSSFSDIGLILAYSGVPMIGGGVLAWAGYSIWRSGRPPMEPRPPETPQSEKKD